MDGLEFIVLVGHIFKMYHRSLVTTTTTTSATTQNASGQALK